MKGATNLNWEQRPRNTFSAFLQNGFHWLEFCDWDSDPAMVVVYAGLFHWPHIHDASPRRHGHHGFTASDHIIEFLKLPFLPGELMVHSPAVPGFPWRQAGVPAPPLTAALILPATASLGDPSLPAPASAPAPAATAATSARPLPAPTAPGPAVSILLPAQARRSLVAAERVFNGTPAAALAVLVSPPAAVAVFTSRAGLVVL